MNINIDDITIKAAGASGVKPKVCPFCGAGQYKENPEEGCFSCGTDIVPEWGTARSEICFRNEISREREAHNKTRRELELYKAANRDIHRIAQERNHYESEAKRLRDIAEEAIHQASLAGSLLAPTLRAELEAILKK